jgi:hypothetical protein
LAARQSASIAGRGRRLRRGQGDCPLVEHLPVLRLVEHERTDGTIRIHVGHRPVVVVLKGEVSPYEAVRSPFDERRNRTAPQIAAFGADLERNAPGPREKLLNVLSLRVRRPATQSRNLVTNTELVEERFPVHDEVQKSALGTPTSARAGSPAQLKI